MDNNMNWGDGVLEEAKADINSRTKGLIKITIDTIFDYLEGKIKELPEIVKHLRNNPETEQKIIALWSEQLFKEGIVPKGYSGLPDNLLISNFHRDGYLEGLYAGYVLAMMALVDINAPKDMILATRAYIRPNLMGHHYDDRDKFISRYKDGKYSWIDKAKQPSSDI